MTFGRKKRVLGRSSEVRFARSLTVKTHPGRAPNEHPKARETMLEKHVSIAAVDESTLQGKVEN